ncbi:hypothetical protein JHW43_007297 [Diplocarpon mali]|nr:hypothetical protein JHW43_007297 [Diplocarpon mali]
MASNDSASSPTENRSNSRNSVSSNGLTPADTSNLLTDRIQTIDSTAPAELSAVVDELLNSLSNKFAGVSSEIFAKMDEMSRRLDNLEATLQNSNEGHDGNSTPQN